MAPRAAKVRAGKTAVEARAIVQQEIMSVRANH
jgi:hypothetical protein